MFGSVVDSAPDFNQWRPRNSEFVETFVTVCRGDPDWLKQEMWYSISRLEKEGATEIQDLDCSPFFNHQHIKKFLPNIFVKLDIFRFYLMYNHNKEFLEHAWGESTLRRIQECFFPIGNSRAAIGTFRSKCSKCRLMIKVGNSLIGFLSESLVFCEKKSEWAICSKKNEPFAHSLIFVERPERSVHIAHFWWATWAIRSHRSLKKRECANR